ncbi:hypothetical protein [Pararhodobacter aggregans]
MATLTESDLDHALRALQGFAPDRLGPLALICTCDQCLPPEVLICLETRPLAAIPPEAVSHWFAAAAAHHADGRPIGPLSTDRAEDHAAEGFAMLIKVLEALAAEMLQAGPGLSALRRDWWFVEPAAWTQRLLACGLPGALPEPARRALDRALMALVDEALATGSARLLDTLEYLGTFGRGLPALMAWVEDQPLRAQLSFWAQVLAGRACAPDARAGRSWEDFRAATRIMPRAMAERMNLAVMNPRLGDLMFRAALRLRDPMSREMAECGYVLWENSVAAMRLPAAPRG